MASYEQKCRDDRLAELVLLLAPEKTAEELARLEEAISDYVVAEYEHQRFEERSRELWRD